MVTTPTTEPVSSTTATTAPVTTIPANAEPPTGPRVPSRDLQRGDTGDEVRVLQERLDDAGFWVGPLDSSYGHLTEQAVLAFQKVQGLPVTGQFEGNEREALSDPVPFRPRSHSGDVWEIDKERQVLVAVRDGQAIWIWNTSTGTEEPYVHDGRSLMADTPAGDHEISWQVDGWRNGALGPIYRPKYFHPDGLAIHGYERVPPVPASHGCVRVTIAAMDFIWQLGSAPVGARVLIYGRTPA